MVFLHTRVPIFEVKLRFNFHLNVLLLGTLWESCYTPSAQEQFYYSPKRAIPRLKSNDFANILQICCVHPFNQGAYSSITSKCTITTGQVALLISIGALSIGSLNALKHTIDGKHLEMKEFLTGSLLIDSGCSIDLIAAWNL